MTLRAVLDRDVVRVFTFMHLADDFIQSDLQCIQAIHFSFISICKNEMSSLRRHTRFSVYAKGKRASHKLYYQYRAEQSITGADQ